MLAGTYVTHGETYDNAPGVTWISRGGKLVGESPRRIAFLKEIFERAPVNEMMPIDAQNTKLGILGKVGEYYLIYFGKDAPTQWAFELPAGRFVRPGLVDFNDPVRAYHVERVKRHVDLAADLRARNVLLVLREYIWQREVIPPQAQWGWAIETCRRIGDYADAKGIDIALELEPFRLSLLNSVGEMERFIDECNHPRVRANIDVSHLVLADAGPEELARLKGKAIHVHISDCNGKVHGDLPPGRGVVKFAPYLQAIKELGMNGSVSIELEYSPDPNRIVEWVEEAYQSTDRLCGRSGFAIRRIDVSPHERRLR
jgi:sugar phosphate isomerase/epimerase